MGPGVPGLGFVRTRGERIGGWGWEKGAANTLPTPFLIDAEEAVAGAVCASEQGESVFQATATLFVNGQRVEGALPLVALQEGFRAMVR